MAVHCCIALFVAVIQGSRPVRRIQGVAGRGYSIRERLELRHRQSPSGRSNQRQLFLHDCRSVCQSSPSLLQEGHGDDHVAPDLQGLVPQIVRQSHGARRIPPPYVKQKLLSPHLKWFRLKRPGGLCPCTAFQALTCITKICLTATL